MFKTHRYLLKTYFLILSVFGSFFIVVAQNNALYLNGAYMVLNGGTFASPMYLVINNGATAGITRSSGWITSEAEGNFVKWITTNAAQPVIYTFPFGYSTTDYIPVSIHKTSIGASDPIIVSTWRTAATDNTPWATSVTNMVGVAGATAITSAIDRFWQIMIPTTVTGTVDLSYRGAENTTTVAPTGNFSGQEWDIPTLQWITPASGTGVGTATAGTVGSVTGITLGGYGTTISSPYVLTAATAPLPIELISFTASCENKNTHIKWTNASETNVWSIELQNSIDMNSWNTIYVAQPSNSSSYTNYNYVYNETSNTAVYYRLKSNNKDGGANMSAIIVSQPCNSEGGNNTLSAFYYQKTLNVLSQFDDDAKVVYSLYDLQGKRIITGEYTAGKGEQMISLPLGDLSNGIYIFNAESNSTYYNRKIIIVQ